MPISFGRQSALLYLLVVVKTSLDKNIGMPKLEQLEARVDVGCGYIRPVFSLTAYP